MSLGKAWLSVPEKSQAFSESQCSYLRNRDPEAAHSAELVCESEPTMMKGLV